MELKDYEQRIGKSRHIEVKMICENDACEKEFWSKWSRVKIGQGRFCSIQCSGISQSKGIAKRYVGKENGKTVFDKSRNCYYVYWFNPETLKRCTTSYARWYWETHRGEIPDKYRASYKDGNQLNIDPSNIILVSPEEFGSAVSQRLMGHTFSEETKQKMSAKKKGIKLSDEHKYKIGVATKRMWKDGIFDDPKIRAVYAESGRKSRKHPKKEKMSRSDAMKLSYKNHPEIKDKISQAMKGRKFSQEHLDKLSISGRNRIDIKGENSKWWKGGIEDNPYPDDFSIGLKKKVKKRDNYTCQSCNEYVYGSKRGHIHHIDGNKQHCDMDNLILLCATCHNAVHGRNNITTDKIIELKSMLQYD